MEEGSDTTPERPRPVPALPRGLADPRPVVVAGTSLWLAGTVLLGVRALTGDGLDVWFWTCLVGSVLGIIGYGVFRWQRSASQRGTRGSWRGSGLGE